MPDSPFPTLKRTIIVRDSLEAHELKVTYDPHAEFQIARRGIPLEWVLETLQYPEATETRGDGKLSYLRCYPQRGKMLRVVSREH